MKLDLFVRGIVVGLIIALVMFVGIETAYSADNLNKTFSDLKHAAGVKARLKISSREPSNTDGYNITLNREDIGICSSNNDCVKGILSHELSHIVLGHNNRPPRKGDEIQADLYSVKILRKAGMNPCAGLASLNAIKRAFGNESSDTHPAPSIRIRALSNVCGK